MRVWCLAALTVVVTACAAGPERTDTSMAAAAARPVSPGTTRVSGTAPPGAFVRLEPLFAHEFPPPSTEGFMDQSGQMFIPGAIVAQTGQVVKFRSSEDVLHNIRVVRSEDKAPIFNIITPPWGAYAHTFDEAGTHDVSCDIHSAMRATILVVPTPYATVAGEDGAFAFDEVMSGPYRLIGFSGENQVERVVEISGVSAEVRVP